MTASERLKNLDVREADDLVTYLAAFPALVEIVEAAELAERKLWYEYRNVPRLAHNQARPQHESWAEGEALAFALAALDKVLKEVKP